MTASFFPYYIRTGGENKVIFQFQVGLPDEKDGNDKRQQARRREGPEKAVRPEDNR